MRYAAARNAAYTFPSPLYVSLIAACVDSRVCTNRDGIGGLNFCTVRTVSSTIARLGAPTARTFGPLIERGTYERAGHRNVRASGAQRFVTPYLYTMNMLAKD